MSLTNLAQIKGGLQLQKDVAALKQSYEAAKVLTQIVKTKADGTNPAVNYNVEELLEKFKNQLDAIAGDVPSTEGGEEGKISLASLAAALDGLKSKLVDDYVRVPLSIVDGATDTTKSEIEAMLPAAQKINLSDEFQVYTDENEVVLDETGAPLHVSFENGAAKFSGTPSVIDEEASAKSDKPVYKPMGSFRAKIFVTSTFKLADLPQDFLLDNNEMELVAYKSAINQIVIDLAKDKSLIEDIKQKVGEKAVQDQLDAALEEVKGDVKALKDAADTEAFDKIAVTAKNSVASFKLSNKPNKRLVRMIINHLTYHENEDFLMDRETQIATWNFTAANGGFDINKDLADAVRFEYFINANAEKNTAPVEQPQGDDTPTVTPEPEPAPSQDPVPPKPSTDPVDDNAPAKKLWSVQFTVPANEAGYNLEKSGAFTAEQLADITDLAAAGPNENGQGRTLELYFVGCGEKKLAEPKPMKWLDGILAKEDEEFVNAVKAEGFLGYESSTGTYFLASGPDFQVITHAEPLTFELAKLDKPYYDK